MQSPRTRLGRTLTAAAVATTVALAGVTIPAASAGRAATTEAVGDDNPSAALNPGPTVIASSSNPHDSRASAARGWRRTSGPTAWAAPIHRFDRTSPALRRRSRPLTGEDPVATTDARTASPRAAAPPPSTATPASAGPPTPAPPTPAPPTPAPPTPAPGPAPTTTTTTTTITITTAPAPTTTAPAPTTTTTAPQSGPGGVPLGTGAHLVFHDEFNGPLNTSVWETCWWYTNPSATGCPHDNGELQWYLKSDPATSNGSLVLTANRQTVSGITSTGQPATYSYTSGEVDTHGTFAFQYGYVEWRAQIPAGQGLWPALWLLPADGSWPPEIDALEVLGNDPATGIYTNHSPDGTSCGHAVHGADLSAAPHVFGVNWQPSGITWYVDGTPVAQCTTANGGISAKPMYLVMNLAVGGNWPGAPNASTVFPARMTIDWVRVWQ